MAMCRPAGSANNAPQPTIIAGTMALNVGSRLGPYEILVPIGAGGMGEVYKARDSRLDRIVAIKVLPAHVSSNPDLRARFEREARALSGFQHPHTSRSGCAPSTQWRRTASTTPRAPRSRSGPPTAGR